MLWSAKTASPTIHWRAEGVGVAIYRLLQNSDFGPEDIHRIAAGYELVLIYLELKDRDDPLTETIAKYVIEAAQAGAKDPEKICSIALTRLRAGDRDSC
jgi:hypothetical protein